MLRVKKRDLRVLLGTQKLKDYLDRIQKKGNLFLLETGQLVATTYYIHDIRMLLLTPETYIYVSYFFFYFSARRCQGDRSKKKPEKLQPSLFLFFLRWKKKEEKLLSPTAVIQLHTTLTYPKRSTVYVMHCGFLPLMSVRKE